MYRTQETIIRKEQVNVTVKRTVKNFTALFMLVVRKGFLIC